MFFTHRVQGAQIGAVLWKPALGQGNPLRRLAGFQRLGAGQIIKAPPGMRFDIRQRLVLAPQIPERLSQQSVLVNIRQIPGVVGVLV